MGYAINMKYSQQVLDQQNDSRAQRQDRWPQTTSAALEVLGSLQNSEEEESKTCSRAPGGHPSGAPHVQVFQRSSVPAQSFQSKSFFAVFCCNVTNKSSCV